MNPPIHEFALREGLLPDVLLTLVVLSMFVERGLAIVFEHRLYLEVSDRPLRGGVKIGYLKEPIAFAVSLAVCIRWDFDVLSALRGSADTDWLGFAITASIVAGGSKASMAFFHDLLNVRSQAARQRAAIAAEQEQARKASAEALSALAPGTQIATTPDDVVGLQRYLARYGYLSDAPGARAAVIELRRSGIAIPGTVKRGELDAPTIRALVKMQRDMGLESSGILDAATRAVLREPRCPVFDTAGIAATEPGRWPSRELRYCYAAFPPSGLAEREVREAIEGAFAEWEEAGVGFSFNEVGAHETHEISIDWRPADDPDFNMETGAIAHADFPPHPPAAATIPGTPPVPLHFDLSERWAVDGHRFSHDLQSIALHEIGHCLGLRHSEDRDSVMHGVFVKGRLRRKLDVRDVDALTDLYA